MRITRCCSIQTDHEFEVRIETRPTDHRQKREQLTNYRRGNSGWWKGENKRGRERRKISRSRLRNPKDVGRKHKGDTHA